MTGLFKWGRPAPEPASAPPDVAPDDRRVRSKVLPRFLSIIKQQPSPVLIDLGPVIGSNISFFGDHLACKIHVEDLFAEVEACAKRGDRDGVRHAVLNRMSHGPASADGILCWDIFDFLDKKASLALAERLVGMLRPGGALHGTFGTTPIELDHYTRHSVESDSSLRVRPYAASPVRRNVLVTRDINRMFGGLAVTESVLLKTGSREMLFRKP